MTRQSGWKRLALACALGVLLGACGGGGGSRATDEAAAAAPVTLASAGGTVVAEGVTIVIPPGAMKADATIRIARDSTGAPPLPQWVQAAGDMLAITPHGSEFSQPVTVRLPVPNVTVQADQRLFIAKAQPGGEWEVLGETVQKDGLLEAQVHSFSYFVPVVVTLLPPISGSPVVEAFEVSSLTLECDGAACASPELLRAMTITATVTNNGGQLPANCVDPKIVLRTSSAHGYDIGDPIDANPGTVVRRDFVMRIDSRQDVWTSGYLPVQARLRCTEATTNAISYLSSRSTAVTLIVGSTSPGTPYVLQFPAVLTQAVGDTPTLRAVMIGGASYRRSDNSFTAPTLADQAVVYLERLAPADTVWRTMATSEQTTANNRPFGSGPTWMYWSFDYALGPLTQADNGAVYRVRGCYQASTATQTTCAAGPTVRLTVVQQTQAASFTQQPRPVLITPGQTASFSVVAAGIPAPTLQWQSRLANSTGDWTDVSAGSGAATPNYTTPVVSLADNGVQYRVLATNSAGSTASQAVTVSVAAAVEGASIVSQPTPLTVVAGSEAVFAVTARGTEALSYQWFKSDSAVGAERLRRAIVGANSSQLKIPNVSVADAGVYFVEVSNAAGLRLSDIVALNVTDVSSTAAVAPSIVTQPAAVAVTEGNVATFAVGVSGSGPLAFQWRKNGVDIVGATAAAYTLAAVAGSDAGTYSVRVSNGTGSVTSQSATLAVAAAGAPAAVAPTIVTQPGSLVVAPGMSATLGVGVQGSGPISYRWLRDGVVVPGQTEAIYGIGAATALDAGSYQVQVSNAAGGPVTSASAQVILLGAPAITVQPANVSGVEGGTATLAVTATGDALRYQWLRNGMAIGGATAAQHTTAALALADHGAVYGVIVYNGAGLVFSQSAVLSVSAAPPPALVGIVRASATGDGGTAMLGYAPSLSANGMRVAFIAPYQYQAYVRDLQAQTLTQVNLKPDGTPSSQGVTFLKLAAGGRFAVFSSTSNDLVAGDTNIANDIFVRDLQAGTTTRVNVSSAGQDTVSGNGSGYPSDISADGRWILMFSYARLDADGRLDLSNCLYLHDRASGQTLQIPNAGCAPGILSVDGRHVLFYTATGTESTYTEHLQLYDHHPTDPAQRVTTTLASYLGNTFNRLALSADGMVIAFDALPLRVEAGATSTDTRIYVIDRAVSAIPVPVSAAAGVRSDSPSLSGDGRYVAFTNVGSAGGAPAVHDRVTRTTRQLQKPSGCCASGSETVLSGDGAVLGFTSYDPELASRPSVGGEVFVAPRP
ncbi:MAG: immunoglobulin domain-containing protein [Pseudomonadota bacterium]